MNRYNKLVCKILVSASVAGWLFASTSGALAAAFFTENVVSSTVAEVFGGTTVCENKVMEGANVQGVSENNSAGLDVVSINGSVLTSEAGGGGTNCKLRGW